MSNSYFKFKQFTVWHDKCAMKVGTDGVLLGAWVDVDNATNILDVGTGTGVVSLMLAQRSKASIIGVEIDECASNQALYNVSNSIWSNRIKIINEDYLLYEPEKRFDVIVSNPPFFENSIKSPDDKRSLARHVDSLNYETLLSKSARILTEDGSFSLIIPTDAADGVERIANGLNLYPAKRLQIVTKPGLAPKRCIITFKFNHRKCLVETILIEKERHIYSPEYIELTKEFYLKM